MGLRRFNGACRKDCLSWLTSPFHLSAVGFARPAGDYRLGLFENVISQFPISSPIDVHFRSGVLNNWRLHSGGCTTPAFFRTSQNLRCRLLYISIELRVAMKYYMRLRADFLVLYLPFVSISIINSINRLRSNKLPISFRHMSKL